MTKSNGIQWMQLNRRNFLASAGAGVLSASMPRGSWAQDASVLKVRSDSDLRSLDPAFSQGLTDEQIHAAMYSKLVQFKPGTWETELDAAASIEQVDATHIKFALRDDIGFSRGFGQMTAEDVKFSYERIVDPKLQSTNRPDFGPLDHVEVTGEREGVIVLKEPYAPLWHIALPYITGNIVSKKAVAQFGGRLNLEPAAESGPYKFDSYAANQKTVLVKNDAYKSSKQAFDRIEVVPIGDENAAEIAFEAGELDFTYVPVSSIKRLRDSGAVGATLKEYPGLGYVWLGMNVENEALKDIRVRQAVQYAINVDMVLQASYFGLGEPATGVVAPGLIGHRPKSIVPPAGDIAKAQKLLEEAGVSGLTLSLDIENTTTNLTTAQIVQANLAQVGITLDIRPHDSASFSALGDQWKDIQLIISFFSMTPDPSYATAWFTCEQVGQWNWARYCDKDFDALHAEGGREIDVTKRDEIYRKAQDLMEESGTFRFITHQPTAVLYRNTIVPSVLPDGFPLLRHFAKA